jgi:hypothetical protein
VSKTVWLGTFPVLAEEARTRTQVINCSLVNDSCPTPEMATGAVKSGAPVAVNFVYVSGVSAYIDTVFQTGLFFSKNLISG